MRIRRTAATLLAIFCVSVAACDSGNRPVAPVPAPVSPAPKNATPTTASNLPSPTNVTTGFAIGNLAPEISGTDLNGEPMKLSEYRGQVVVLDFWGNW